MATLKQLRSEVCIMDIPLLLDKQDTEAANREAVRQFHALKGT